jgi:hypothetical protein
MIEAAVHYAVIEEILLILSGELSPDDKNKAILSVCQPIAKSLSDRQLSTESSVKR